MKSTLLKTLAAASLVATTHAAEVQVLGFSYKERGVNAPTGTIEPNPGTVQATRAYLIIDNTVTSPTPNVATYIEYKEVRNAGVISRVYTVDTNFKAFLADSITGDSGGPRIYGHMHVPLTIAQVANPLIPFSGNITSENNFPRKISLDQTVFQTGASDAATGPRIVLKPNSSTLRSVMSGSGNPVNITAIDIADAADQLVKRLTDKGYARIAGEAPTIVKDLPPTAPLQDGESKDLSVDLDPDVFPGPDDTFAGPTYQWFKAPANDPTNFTAIAGATNAIFKVIGGTSTATNGSGIYRVVVTNDLGSVTSSGTVVTSKTTSFATDLPTTFALFSAGSVKFAPTLNPTPIATPTYQWKKGAAQAGPFNDIAAGIGGTSPTLTVIAGEAATGAGFYRLDVTTSAGTISSTVCNVTVTAAAGTNFTFTTNLARTAVAPFNSTIDLAPVVNAAAGTPTVASRQWFKAPSNDPTNFVAIPLAQGGQSDKFVVTGNPASFNGPGVYKMVATSTGATPQVITTVECVVTTGP